jgi:hypothetical protein
MLWHTMDKYIEGPEVRGGVNYYTLKFSPPAVSRKDPPKPRLDRQSISKLYTLAGNFVLLDPTGRWVIG